MLIESKNNIQIKDMGNKHYQSFVCVFLILFLSFFSLRFNLICTFGGQRVTTVVILRNIYKQFKTILWSSAEVHLLETGFKQCFASSFRGRT